MLKFRLMTGVQSLVMISILLLTACGATPAELTPTLNPDQIRTEAVATFSSALTLTALAAPSDTPIPTLTPAPTFPPLATSTAGTPFVSGPTIAPTTGCYGLAFVSDVTIPDNTAVTPGQTFTKTWRVRNTGTCVWDAGFKFAFVSGDAMGGTTQTLAASVAAGTEFNVSVPMTAPTNKSGAVQGYWRMSTAAGQFFGDQVYVLVVVGGTAATSTGTSTSSGATATPTPSATPTATPT
ncbi:MAG: hypothetical protein L0287_01630 [Anaerolineae bacterium]|nr:hypothetical protein [Anaerolineae bacterium]MCI0610436.1 hypothetical protein [Anaerolineae bacterium]